MTNHQVERSKTFYTDPMINAYLSGDQLQEFYNLYPSMDNLSQMMSERQMSLEKRQELANVLLKQYKDSGIELNNEGDKVKKNIEALHSAHTYTVTTGQQIHVGLGPLYVLYKITDTIRLARDINESYPDVHVVPVFWMATEDHDLDEIKDVHLFGKTFSWETEQNGAVGRMSTNGITALFKSIREEFSLNDHQEQLLNLFLKGYSNNTLAEATRYILHHLFKAEGLLILDGDDKVLKRHAESLFVEEMQGAHYEGFMAANAQLKKQDMPLQIHIREVNLFWLGGGDRERITRTSEGYVVGNQHLCSSTAVKSFVEQHIEDISPNVALRPVYQELILPNLIYVGGNAEIKYWMQLRSVFDYQGITMPLVYPRSSFVLLPQSASKYLDASMIEHLYLSDEELSNKHLDHIKNLRVKKEEELKAIESALAVYAQGFKESFKGANLDAKVAKIEPKIKELADITARRIDELAENDPTFNKFMKLKRQFFNAKVVQERKKHILEYAEHIYQYEQFTVDKSFSNLLKTNHLL